MSGSMSLGLSALGRYAREIACRLLSFTSASAIPLVVPPSMVFLMGTPVKSAPVASAPRKSEPSKTACAGLRLGGSRFAGRHL